MLAISYNDFSLYGCPNCGCDTAINGNCYGNGTSFGTCENCKLKFIILVDGVTKSSFGIKENSTRPFEYPNLIEHPRKGIEKWEYQWPDDRPDSGGEYFSPRGIGYDLAGFVNSKKAGERIIKMVKQVLCSDNVKTWLDYRLHEPKWIQVKFQNEEFNLEKLYNLTKDSKILTFEILEECKL